MARKKKMSKESLSLMAAAFVGAMVSQAVGLLTADVSSFWNWFYFMIVMLILFLAARVLLKLL